MIYAIYVALVLVAFLVVLNEFIRGAKKAQIDAVLSLLLLGLVITAFFVAGWKLGLLAIVVAFLSAVVTRPIAARLASRLFATSSGSGGGYVDCHLALSRKSPKSLENQLTQINSWRKCSAAVIARLMQKKFSLITVSSNHQFKLCSVNLEFRGKTSKNYSINLLWRGRVSGLAAIGCPLQLWLTPNHCGIYLAEGKKIFKKQHST